jgi:uncharacterized protein
MLPLLIFSVIILLIDLYAYKGIKLLWNETKNTRLKTTLNIFYWLVPFLLFASVIALFYIRPLGRDPKIFNSYLYVVAFAFLFYFPKLIFIFFHFIEDITFLLHRLISFFRAYGRNDGTHHQPVERDKWKLLSKTGLVISLIPFLMIIYGIAIERFDFQVIHQTIEHESIPSAFDGFRIVHISDLHAGSFYGHERQVERAVRKINRQNADLILFTGDLVNNFTSEIDTFLEILQEMNAAYGMYSVLGNHDYGDYFQWESEVAKEKNMEQMISAHREIGFRLLLNEWDSIVVGGEMIAIIGVENWGEPPFPQYGDLEEASRGTEGLPFRILLTHDPSHWDAEVLDGNIELTLAGHTHGFQFGIELGNISWSPSKFKYPQWGGLYSENSQFLYVNRGLGYVGFPGRVGMPPEITVIELRSPRNSISLSN